MAFYYVYIHVLFHSKSCTRLMTAKHPIGSYIIIWTVKTTSRQALSLAVRLFYSYTHSLADLKLIRLCTQLCLSTGNPTVLCRLQPAHT